MPLALNAHKETCTSCGNALPSLVCTDDPYRDNNFFNTIFSSLKTEPHAATSNNVDANDNQFNNNNENLATSSTSISIDDCIISRNHNESGSLCSGIKDEMNNKENMNDKAISLDCEWEVYRNSSGCITGTSKCCTM